MEPDSVNASTVDLTEPQERLCAWLAEQARVGATRALYQDARRATGIASDGELTEALRQFRERLDDIHEMAQSPIVNSHTPYFDVSAAAHRIWSDYCQTSGRRLRTSVDGPVAGRCPSGIGEACDCALQVS